MTLWHLVTILSNLFYIYKSSFLSLNKVLFAHLQSNTGQQWPGGVKDVQFRSVGGAWHITAAQFGLWGSTIIKIDFKTK